MDPTDMGSDNVRRSQAILRMPIDSVCAQMILHDGDRSEVLLFIAPSEDIGRLLGEGAPFMPVVRNGRVCMVARTAIAGLGIPARVAPAPSDDDLPMQIQKVSVKLRNGAAVDGELRWVMPLDRQKTIEYLNGESPCFEVYSEDTVWHVVKSHVATVVDR
jgi:hypothetical protein